MTERLRIAEFSDELAPEFLHINREWIEAMFSMEPHDRDVLENPRAEIIDRGGHVLFVEDEAARALGTCALMPAEDGYTELTKMGVRPEARGRGVGDFLLRAVLERASTLGLDARLFLLTNSACEAAIHLYERAGFEHDAEIMERFGGTYGRADVAMRFRPRQRQLR